MHLSQGEPSKITDPASFLAEGAIDEVIDWGSNEEESNSEEPQHYIDLSIRTEEIESAQKASISHRNDDIM